MSDAKPYTAEELARFRAWIARIDAGGNGTPPSGEIRRFLATLGAELARLKAAVPADVPRALYAEHARLVTKMFDGTGLSDEETARLKAVRADLDRAQAYARITRLEAMLNARPAVPADVAETIRDLNTSANCLAVQVPGMTITVLTMREAARALEALARENADLASSNAALRCQLDHWEAEFGRVVDEREALARENAELRAVVNASRDALGALRTATNHLETANELLLDETIIEADEDYAEEKEVIANCRTYAVRLEDALAKLDATKETK